MFDYMNHNIPNLQRVKLDYGGFHLYLSELAFINQFYSVMTRAEILTSNSVGAKLFFLGCNQDNNHGSNFINKKKLLGSTRKGN